MIIDLVILLPIIGFSVLGFRDGSARKLTAIVVAIVAMFVGHLVMHDVGTFLVEKLNFQPAKAPTTGFLIVFVVLFLLEASLYRLLTGNYKFGGIADKIVGVPLGFCEGVLIMSIFIFILNMGGPPSPRTVRESRFYKPVASVAPQIFDLYEALVPVAKQTLEDVTNPGAAIVDTLSQESIEQATSPGAAKVDSILKRPQ